jgi:hypothetical protein
VGAATAAATGESSSGHGFHKKLISIFCSEYVPDNYQNMITWHKQQQQQPARDSSKHSFFLYIYIYLYYFNNVPKQVLLGALGNFLVGFSQVSAHSWSFLWWRHITHSTFLPVGKSPALNLGHLAF